MTVSLSHIMLSLSELYKLTVGKGITYTLNTSLAYSEHPFLFPINLIVLFPEGRVTLKFPFNVVERIALLTSKSY